jgi:O-antigen ligase
MIDRRGLGGSEDAELTVRPGGFLNPNMTAAIALVLAFVASRLSTGARDAIHLACLLVASIVVVLAQSRAGLLALGVHVGCLAWRRPAVLVAVGVAGVAAVAWIGADALLDVAGLVEHLLDRFSRDNSSDERLVVLELGMAAIDERPWFGHGYRHLEHVFGRSAHNEFVETTVNFGFVGLAVALVGVTLILLPASVHLLVVCVAPSVLFSHNFLDTVELQACLGLALAVDRSGRGR